MEFGTMKLNFKIRKTDIGKEKKYYAIGKEIGMVTPKLFMACFTEQ